MRSTVKYIVALLGAGTVLFSCNKSNLQPVNPEDFPFGYGFSSTYTSRNTAFEEDWASQNTIDLVTDYYKENGRIVTKTVTVSLPWAYSEGPRQWLPQYTARNMAELNRDDWRLVFNLTGIDQKPGEHFFGLYNRFTGTLRVFYYLTEDRIPPHDGNDHAWSMGFTKDLLEHVIFQFAIPYEEKVPEEYKDALGGNDALYKTTALTSSCSDDGKVVPAIGWWAYDINLSPLRSHDFFASDRSVMTPGMLVSNEDNVVLHSLLHGSLNGSFGGSMNLKSLRGGGTNLAGQIVGLAGSSIGGFLLNTKVIEAFVNGGKMNSIWALIGSVVGLTGKSLETFLTKDTEDPDKLGQFNGTVNLTLDAGIETVGEIGGARTSLVPSPGLNVAGFFRQATADGEPTGFGQGVWNISRHPVIYVVSDAYFGDKPQFSSVDKVQSEGRTAYELTIDPDRLGLHNIAFLDPTSLGDIRINPVAVPEGAETWDITANYGVFPAATPGYTSGYRHVLGLDYTNPELTDRSSYQTDTDDVGFRIVRLNHADPMFLDAIEEGTEDFIGHRLSQQQLTENIHRRLFGTSFYFSNPNAGYDQVDDVAFVSDPEVFLPVDSKDRLLFGTELPDYVVSVTLTTKGAPDETGACELQVNTLRFLPRIVFIKASEGMAVYKDIQNRCMGMLSADSDIRYPSLPEQMQKIRDIVNSLPKEQ